MAKISGALSPEEKSVSTVRPGNLIAASHGVVSHRTAKMHDKRM
jgi:hypothetical protein